MRSLLKIENSSGSEICCSQRSWRYNYPAESRNHHTRAIYAELGEIVYWEKPRRTSDSETTLFKSVGLGILDCAAAWLAYNKAKEKGTYKEIDISS